MIFLAISTILLPCLGAVLVAASPHDWARLISQLVAALTLAVVLVLAVVFSAADRVAVTQPVMTFGSTEILGVTIDTVSVLIAVAVIAIGLLVAIYSASYLTPQNREHPDRGRRLYYAFLLVFIGAMPGLVFSSTITGQLAFFEITGACSWALIGYYETPKALRAGTKALLITHVASLGLYLAAALLLVDTGTFALSAIGQLGSVDKTIILLAILFAAWGKSAQLPFHMWLPAAMEAPTPVSAYLHAASMVKVGVYIFARGLMAANPVPEAVGWVGAVMAVATLVYGFFMYLPQLDMKLLLVYSTITQLAYMFLGLSLSVFGSDLAFKGSIAHVFNHAFAKTLFFLVAGALGYTTGTRMLPSLRGIMAKAPLLGVAFVVAALAITGVPPFSGFFSKFAILAGGFSVVHRHLWLLPLLLLAVAESIGAFAWFLKWIGYSVFGEPSEAMVAALPVPSRMQIVLIVLMVMAVCSSAIAAYWLG